MCGIYLLACLYILGTHSKSRGFSPNYQPGLSPDAAFFGGLPGVLIIGVKRDGAE